MKIGDIVMWVPKKARQKCYEHPIAYAHVRVKILHGPMKTRNEKDLFGVEILDFKDKQWLTKPKYLVAAPSLQEIK